MNFTPAALEGVWIVDLEPHADERGFFARSFCREEFARLGLHTDWPQCNLSRNRQRGTIRGLHFQAPPNGEVKLVRCSAGVIFDVVVDVRSDSPTFRCWLGVELSADTGRSLYVPSGFAHGFQTLTDNADVFYMMGSPYLPASAGGLRWDDPTVRVQWPLPAVALSSQDAELPLFGDFA